MSLNSCNGTFVLSRLLLFFFFKQKTANEMRISAWSSDVCSSDLLRAAPPARSRDGRRRLEQPRGGRGDPRHGRRSREADGARRARPRRHREPAREEISGSQTGRPDPEGQAPHHSERDQTTDDEGESVGTRGGTYT